MKTIFGKLNAKRQENTLKYRKLNIFLLFFFPIFICIMSEYNQDKSFLSYITFIINRPSVFIFDVLVCQLIFWGLYYLIRKGWIAVLIQTVAIYTISIAELFKFDANGNHFRITDALLAKDVKSLSSFAYIKITPELVINVIIALVFVGIIVYFNPICKLKYKFSLMRGLSFVAVFAGIICIPGIATPIYNTFEIDTSPSVNPFVENEKFNNNGLIAYNAQIATELIASTPKEPDTDVELLMQNTDAVPASATPKTAIRPNVLVIMSEAFADFRTLDMELPVKDAYDSFDNIAEKGFGGKTVVPTFASFTVRTEFELIFGLPVRSLNDPTMPQSLMDETKMTTIPGYYKEKLGYETYYVHPFDSFFYGRIDVYPYLGFDKLYFRDENDGVTNFDVPVETYGFNDYYSDKTVFNQLEKIMEDSDKPVYIHTTTMQNHTPYVEESEQNELEYYLGGVKLTLQELEKFTERLEDFDEPTILLFVGDHFPSLRSEDSVYEKLGINSDNCSEVFEQNYLVWANYDYDYSALPEERISTFYLPYVLLDGANLQENSFIETMLEKKSYLPIYTTPYNDKIAKDDYLDTVTYDRIIGKKFTSWDNID